MKKFIIFIPIIGFFAITLFHNKEKDTYNLDNTLNAVISCFIQAISILVFYYYLLHI